MKFSTIIILMFLFLGIAACTGSADQGQAIDTIQVDTVKVDSIKVDTVNVDTNQNNPFIKPVK